MDQIDFVDALRPHYDDALRYCHALTARAHHTQAEDLLQDALLKVLRNYCHLRDPSKFRAWLFQIITRTHHSAARRMMWRRFYPFAHVTHIPNVYGDSELTSERLLLLTALAQLPQKQRSAFLLFELAGFSLEEIRAIQGDRSLSAVKSRLKRTREKLRTYLLELEADQSRLIRSPIVQDLNEETVQITQQALDSLHGR